MNKITKVSHGYFVQEFSDGVCVKQEFESCGPVEYENNDGKLITNIDKTKFQDLYHPFGNLTEQQISSLQNKVSDYLDSLDDYNDEPIISRICEIIGQELR